MESADDPASDSRGRRNRLVIQAAAIGAVLLLVWFAIERGRSRLSSSSVATSGVAP